MKYLFILTLLFMGCSSNNKSTVEPECEPIGLCTNTTPNSTLAEVYCLNDYWGTGPQAEDECVNPGWPGYEDNVYTWTEEFCDCESFCNDFGANNPGENCWYVEAIPEEDWED